MQTARATSLPPSFRMSLRALTAPAHERVDAAFSHLNLTDPAGYRRFLHAHYAILPECERVLAESGATDLLPDWPSRVRVPALAADIATVGGVPARGIARLAPLSPAGVWGMMYVLEGSRLGGAVLARRVQDNPDPLCRTATRYLRHGQGLGLWPSFVAALEAAPAVQDEPDAVIASAMAAFDLFEAAAQSPATA